MIEGPVLEAGTWTFRDRRGAVRVLFAGRGPGGERDEVLRRLEPGAPPVAWAKQVHSATVLGVLPARPGCCGEGDALVAPREPGLALAVVTADCVPVLLAGPEGIAAAHAGWRGIAAGVVPETVRAATREPGAWTAWIGPSIGACCYEVGEEVAEQVASASGEGVAIPGPNGRPHLDLVGAVRDQLEAAGIGEVIYRPRCTRCDEERLWSYRRDGKGAGRNLAFVWVERGSGEEDSR